VNRICGIESRIADALCCLCQFRQLLIELLRFRSCSFVTVSKLREEAVDIRLVVRIVWEYFLISSALPLTVTRSAAECLFDVELQFRISSSSEVIRFFSR